MTYHVETRIPFEGFQDDFDWEESHWSLSAQPILEVREACKIASLHDQTLQVRIISSKGEILVDNLPDEV